MYNRLFSKDFFISSPPLLNVLYSIIVSSLFQHCNIILPDIKPVASYFFSCFTNYFLLNQFF